MTSVNKQRFTCYVCGKRRYEEKLIPVTALNVIRFKTNIETAYVCKPFQPGNSSLILNRCSTKHLVKLHNLAARFQKLAEIFDNSRESELSSEGDKI